MEELDRQIILYYNQAEKLRLGPVYSVMESMHPSLHGLLDSIYSDSPFSERLNLEGLTAFFHDAGSPEGIDLANRLSEASERYVELRNMFYESIVDTVKQISGELSFVPEEDIEGTFEVITSRAAKRTVCEALYQSQSAYIRLIIETFSAYIKEAEKKGIDAFRQKLLVPEPDALDELETALWRYRQADLDRIYGGKPPQSI